MQQSIYHSSNNMTTTIGRKAKRQRDQKPLTPQQLDLGMWAICEEAQGTWYDGDIDPSSVKYMLK
jgi:hypothetical protein